MQPRGEGRGVRSRDGRPVMAGRLLATAGRRAVLKGMTRSMQGASGNVLVVDDDPGIRGFILMTLRAEGYSVAVAANGRQGLERIAAQRPDVILLDLSMPIMNGWQFQERLREMQLDIPLIFMTAGYSARHQAERYGAAGYLSKPFEVEDLLKTIGQFTRAVRP